MERIFLKLRMVYTVAMAISKASHVSTINISTLLEQRYQKSGLPDSQSKIQELYLGGAQAYLGISKGRVKGFEFYK